MYLPYLSSLYIGLSFSGLTPFIRPCLIYAFV
nr:MAG TPA: hypothetical protein [Caudoviricetes sp.]